MTLTDVETAVRQDLNDTDPTNYRWPTAILDRCIARAVKEYSFVWPRLQGIVIPVVPGVRAYPEPSPSSLAVPAAPALTALPSGGSLPAGAVYVKVTAAAGSSETAPSAEASVAVAGNGAIAVNIAAVAGARVYHVYAGAAFGGEMWNGCTTVTGPGAYTIASLAPLAATPPGGSAQQNALVPLKLSEPVASVQAWWIEEIEFPVGYWPPRTVPFEEQGGLFVLNVDPNVAPNVNSTVMNVLYAAIHELDVSGSTVLEQDSDVLALGAYGYACLQYGTAAADNFRFQDGEMRDSLDDTMVPAMWLKLGQQALAQYQAKLDDIRRRRDYQTAAILHWGDVPRRWDRL
ncbi:MAG: hypothetical protein JO247_19055 [Chloroflexi bacterium]|nr:hypothetical protein [Chloroflexota bacterium]